MTTVVEDKASGYPSEGMKGPSLATAVEYCCNAWVLTAKARALTDLMDAQGVWGMFLDGALWDRKSHALQESNPKELFVTLPSLHLLPMHHSELEGVKDSDVGGTAHKYVAPCYKTSVRFGVLSTTGHSTNFVMMFRIPMDPKHNQRHWIKRGLAMLSSLDD